MMILEYDCYPAGPAGPYVAGGPIGPDDYLQVLESCDKLVLDHADPAGQHAIVLNTMESLGDAVFENILDGRPMEGITCPELLEYSLRLLDATLDSRLTEGITNLEHAAPGVSLDSGPMEGMLCLEPLEQSVLNSSLVARHSKCAMEERSEWKSVINPAISYTLDSRPMEGINHLKRSALGVSLDSGPTEGASCLEPLEQWVFSSSPAAQPVAGVAEKGLDWKLVIQPVQDSTPDGQPMEGTTYLEHSALGVSLDSGLMEGMPCTEPLEQSVLGECLVTRPEGTDTPERPALASRTDHEDTLSV